MAVRLPQLLSSGFKFAEEALADRSPSPLAGLRSSVLAISTGQCLNHSRMPASTTVNSSPTPSRMGRNGTGESTSDRMRQH